MNQKGTGRRPWLHREDGIARCPQRISRAALNHHDQDRHYFCHSYFQNLSVNFSACSCCLRRLAIDKDSQIAFLIFYEVIEVFLVDLSFFQENETPFEFLCILPD